MPWLHDSKLKKREFVLCKVEKIEVLFPSERSLTLIKQYGSDQEVPHTPQIIQRLTLSVVA